jgi:hypothetical protein
VFLAVLLTFRKRDVALQLTGCLFPATLWGAAILVSSRRQEALRMAEIAACVVAIGVMIGTRVPRAWSALERYTDKSILAKCSITLEEFDAIERAAGRRSILVDTGSNARLGIAAIVELGRRNLRLQYTPESWWTLFGGWRRSWSVPATLLRRNSDSSHEIAQAPSPLSLPGAIFHSSTTTRNRSEILLR